MRDLLCKCKLATKIGLKKTTQALFNNLKKYYSDKQSIWKFVLNFMIETCNYLKYYYIHFFSSCFKHLGKNHSKFVLSLVSYLVSLHPFIDVTEPDINDMFCNYSISLTLVEKIYNRLFLKHI